jgi:fumarate hydratase subunit alpha
MMKIKTIHASDVSNAIAGLIKEASFNLPPSVEKRYDEMIESETTDTARDTLRVLKENGAIAAAEGLPLCQDCGMVIVFVEAGSNVVVDGPLDEAINRGVEEAYRACYLRKSIVGDPLRRNNTGTNTPAFIHVEHTGKDRLGLTVFLKGGGSENMSSLKMFRPTATEEMILDHIEKTVIEAGPNPCPPLFLGVGIGGTADTALLNAKKAVLRGPGMRHPDPFYAGLEDRIMERINRTGIGPLGFGGRHTAAGVFILEAPTHIATLPVALNMTCHSLRYRRTEL